MTPKKILLTGAFGNIGEATLRALIQRGYTVRCFDMPTKRNQRMARRWRHQVEIVWGDLRHKEDVQTAVQGMDVVIHLAFVIPKLSATGMESESHPAWAYAINVQGSQNLLEAMTNHAPEARLLFTSSLHVYGLTQHLPPPRKVSDPLAPVDHYSRHKVHVEALVQRSGLTWTIFRLGASMPLQMIVDPGMFDVPLDNRIEFVHRDDVALAIANALACEEVWGRIWHIGGGPRNQFLYGEMAAMILEALGVGMLPPAAFATEPYPTDWLDTEESQRVLQFQRRSLEDYVADMRKQLGWRRAGVRIFRPLVRRWLLQQSPYMRKTRFSVVPLTPRVSE